MSGLDASQGQLGFADGAVKQTDDANLLQALEQNSKAQASFEYYAQVSRGSWD